MAYNPTYNHSNASNLHTPYNQSTANLNTPYGSGDPYYNESTGFITPANPKKGTSKWVKIGIPVAVIVIAAAVVGAIFGVRASKNSSSTSSKSSSADTSSGNSDGSGMLATATDSLYLLPIYPSTVRDLAYVYRVARYSGEVFLVTFCCGCLCAGYSDFDTGWKSRAECT